MIREERTLSQLLYLGEHGADEGLCSHRVHVQHLPALLDEGSSCVNVPRMDDDHPPFDQLGLFHSFVLAPIERQMRQGIIPPCHENTKVVWVN